jgi:arylsulfatase A-like enzyme
MAPDRAILVAIALLGTGCGSTGGDSRPSVVLVVIDTLGASAVSFYGEVEGTTPTLDGLAASGVAYLRASAPAPWTVPSHASLLSGLEVDQHRVGMRDRLLLPEEVVTLAERLQAAGYQTAAFSENMLVSDSFAMLQGFEHRRATRVIKKSDELPANVFWEVSLLEEIRAWLAERRRGPPFFLFVNIFDPHAPYSIRERNPWVPATASAAEVSRRAQYPEELLCDSLPSPGEIAIQRGLYLGDVAAADAKLSSILDAVRRHGGAERLLTIVTSDHGELFGDRRLLGHEFSLRSGVLRVPLIVHGVEGALPAVVDAPVSLIDIAPSILKWAELDGASLPGRVLPTLPAEVGVGDPVGRRIAAAYGDEYVNYDDRFEGLFGFGDHAQSRSTCGPADPVFGAMVAITEFPFKLHWFEHYPPQLYDLGWDPREQSDLASHRPELVARLSAEALQVAEAAGLTSSPGDPRDAVEPPSPEALEALKQLGYLE